MVPLKYISMALLLSITITTCDKLINSELCNVCKCTNREDGLMIVNCAKIYLKGQLKDWPNLLKNIAFTKPEYMILTLNGNDLNKIETMPAVANASMDISFVNCNLTEIQEGAFKNLKSLLALDLSFNKLSNSALKGIIFREPNKNDESTPLDLEILNLGNNMIHTLDRKLFQFTPNLRVLYLNDNKMNIIDSVTMLAISKVTQLEVLDLSRNDLNVLPSELMHKLKNLKELYLTGNRFTSVPNSLGSVSNSLTYLAMNENKITELNDNSFLGLWRLERLEVSGMKSLTSVKANAFLELKSLVILYLSENSELEDINHQSFTGLKEKWTLKEIYLNDNKLKYLPKDLMPWKLIDNINLEKNPWVCDCKTALSLASGLAKKLSKASHPKCVEPLYTSGRELRDLRVEDVCPSTNNTISYKTLISVDDDSTTAEYTKTSRILIIFSATIIMIISVSIITMKLRQWRNNGNVVTVGPIKYTNVNLP